MPLPLVTMFRIFFRTPLRSPQIHFRSLNECKLTCINCSLRKSFPATSTSMLLKESRTSFSHTRFPCMLIPLPVLASFSDGFVPTIQLECFALGPVPGARPRGFMKKCDCLAFSVVMPERTGSLITPCAPTSLPFRDISSLPPTLTELVCSVPSPKAG